MPEELEIIEDTETPLAALPKTGDRRQAGMLWLLIMITGQGMLLSAEGLRKRKES